ncbi:MAG: hypothetical protein Q8L48_11950 [Archangium sp.]|nr:hypothetical protein [Archangium sp.]
MWRQTALVVLVVATAGCNCGWVCTSDPITGGPRPTTCAPDCCARWQCGADVFEVKCTLDAGTQSCSCIANGVKTGEFVNADFCDADGFAYTANGRCHWRIAGRDGIVPPPP